MAALVVVLMLIVFLLPMIVSLGILLVGLVVGSSREQEHFRDLDRREAASGDILLTNLKTFPGAVSGALPPQLVTGEVTIASDAMKNWLARWRKLFGGEIRSYESLQRRARREACLRLVEQARRAGYNAVGNLRLDGVDIAGAATTPKAGKQAAIVSVIASGTAYCWAPSAGQSS